MISVLSWKRPIYMESKYFEMSRALKWYNFNSHCVPVYLRRSSFSDFAQKHGKDDRFKGIEKMRDRESLFNEFILEVRRREKDEKIQKKESVSMNLKIHFVFIYAINICFYLIKSHNSNIS